MRVAVDDGQRDDAARMVELSQTTSPTRMPAKFTLPPLRRPDAEPSKITRNGTFCLALTNFW